MKKSRFIPAFLLSAALLSGLAGCKKETEYYNPNAQTSSVTETQTELQTEPSTQASTEESTEASTEASTEESTEASTEESTAVPVVSKELAVGDIWYVNTDSLNIRDYPSTEGNKIGELYRGEEVRILALAENGWVQIHSATMDGYVKADFLVSSPVSNREFIPGLIAVTAALTLGCRNIRKREFRSNLKGLCKFCLTVLSKCSVICSCLVKLNIRICSC